MSKALIYRFTFIDVDDIEEEVTGMKKSASVPALSTTLDLENEAHVSETQQREYVSTLPTQAAPAGPPPASDGAEPSNSADAVQAQMPSEATNDLQGSRAQDAQEASSPLTSWPSCGSVGHPELCCRPCVHYAAGRCAEEYSCGYCHMPHEIQPKLDKLQRTFVQELPAAVLLATLLPRLRARAEAGGIAVPVEPVLRLVEARLAELASPESERVNAKKLKNLGRALSKMSFANLLKLAGRAPLPAPAALELRESLEALRQQFAAMPPTSEAASTV